MNRGYTKRWRKKWDRGYHQDPLLWVMMDYFIDYANYKESTVYCAGVGLMSLKRGQHIYSLRRLSEFMNVDMGQIRRRLKILETIQFLSLRTTRHFSLATVINYDLYQNQELMCDTPSDMPSDKQTTNKRQTNDKQTTLPNKDKKEKNIKKTTYTSGFEKFWLAYPKKIGKGAAFQSWLKIKPSNGTRELILAAVAKQCQCEQWCKDSGQFIPNPATWLNQCRWDDDTDMRVKSDFNKRFENYKKYEG